MSTQRGGSHAQQVFSLPMRVYYKDTDAGGVVYHASYVNFMENARTEWLRSFGYTNPGLMKDFGIIFVVHSLKLTYLKPALLDDMLAVTAQVKEMGRSRVKLHQSVLRDDELLAEGEVHLVCVTVDGFRPVAAPDLLRERWKG